jgi:UDP-4-amino-4,6-dideoxy-N-acetyl-beta-L-altrosamine transaminase
MPNTKHQTLPYGRQTINEDDVLALTDALCGDFLTQGPTVGDFERALCDTVGSIHATATSSATTALHLAYAALGLTDRDTLWTSPVTFVSTANAARFCNATVNFVDVDPANGNMCPVKLAEKLERASKVGGLPKIVVPVHLGGSSCRMTEIRELCNVYGVHVVEDASHALGASYEDTRVGECRYSDAAVFSFHPVKMITTGEGGCVTTNNASLASKVEALRSHGITKDPHHFINPSDGGWYYEQQGLGFNYRITDIQSALGISQLKKLKGFVDARNEIANWYNRTLPHQAEAVGPARNTRSSYHLMMILLPDAKTRRAVYDILHSNHVMAQVHYIPVHYQPYYQKLGFKLGDFPNAEIFYSRVISLPIFPGLTQTDVSRVCGLVDEGIQSCA